MLYNVPVFPPISKRILGRIWESVVEVFLRDLVWLVEACLEPIWEAFYSSNVLIIKRSFHGYHLGRRYEYIMDVSPIPLTFTLWVVFHGELVFYADRANKLGVGAIFPVSEYSSLLRKDNKDRWYLFEEFDHFLLRVRDIVWYNFPPFLSSNLFIELKEVTVKSVIN
jgi:hypothetical protein